MICQFIKLFSSPEQGVLVQFAVKEMLSFIQFFGIYVEYRQAHPAADVYSYSIGDHHVIGCQYPAYGESITGMCVRHKSAGNRYRQPRSLVHLRSRSVLDMVGPEYIELDSMCIQGNNV